jgi:PPOX class probable FMN-dependent enzyme
MHITTLDALRTLYALPRERSVKKALPQLDPHCTRFIGLSPLVVLASSGLLTCTDGALDASPRGGDPGFVKVLDARTLLIPDAPGNNRLDTLENIIRTGQVGMLFLVPGIDDTLRVNGTAILSTAETDLSICTDAKRVPKLVIRVTVQAAYLHCGKALMRSALWDASRHMDRAAMPSMGEMMKDQIGEDIPAETQAQMLVRYAQDL